MARATFGGGASDFTFTVTAGGLLRIAPATLTMWTAETGGTQITDLLWGAQAVTAIPVGTDGQVPSFQGPDGVYELWADAGGTTRVLLGANADAVLEAAGRAEVARDEAEAFGGTNNTQVAAMVTGTGPTKDALSATIAEVVGVVNVRNNGVVGDGATNDTTAINDLIAAVSAYTAAGKQTRIQFPDGTYLTDGLLVKSNVWLDFGNSVIKKRSNGTGLNNNSLLRAAETLTGTTYYGTYKNIKITGGVFDPNGFTCPAHIVRLYYVEDLVMQDVTVKHSTGIASWAFALGGRRLNLDGLKVLDGGEVFQDGIHIVHGQDITITRPMVHSGDDSISIGGEPTDTFLPNDPDPIARVTVASPVLVSARVSNIKIYVQATAPNVPAWTVSDINIIGAVGGSKGSAPISIRDLGGFNRIKNVNVTDFSFYAGDPATAGSAWPGTSRGVLIESANNVRLRGRLEYRFDNTATSAWRHVETINGNGLDLQVDTDRIGRGGGYDIKTSSRVTLRGTINGSSDTDWQLVRLTSSDVDLQHLNLLSGPKDKDAVLVVAGAGTKIKATGGRWESDPTSTAGSGVGWASASDLTSLTLQGVDTSGMPAPLQSSYTSLAYLRVSGSGNARNMAPSTTVTGNDTALPALRVYGANGQTGNVAEVNAFGGTALWAVTSAGTVTQSGGQRLGTRGTVSAPAFTYSADADTGMWSPGVDIVGLVAGGVEVFRASSTRPALTYSRTGETAAAAQIRAALVALKLVTDSTTA